jgi:hypothetical protein
MSTGTSSITGANLAIWPDTLPLPRVDGYALSAQPNTLRTELEAGAARVRLRSQALIYKVQAQWRFSPEAFALFDAWWFHRLNQGVAWFAMPLTAGLGLQLVQARFAGAWDSELLAGGRWQVKAQLEVQDLPRLSSDETEVAAALGPAAIDIGTRLHAWLHESLAATDYW